jgi:hypothetical protein
MAMNWRRILYGGLAAGLLMSVVDFLVGTFVLAPRYARYQEIGIFLKEPRLPLFPLLWVLGTFAEGLLLAWLYAAVRPRLGPGPKTAVLVALAVGLMAHVPLNFSMATWGIQGRFLPFVWMLSGLAQFLLGTLLAGFIYKEKEPAGS